jgi:hypothetical protein
MVYGFFVRVPEDSSGLFGIKGGLTIGAHNKSSHDVTRSCLVVIPPRGPDRHVRLIRVQESSGFSQVVRTYSCSTI